MLFDNGKDSLILNIKLRQGVGNNGQTLKIIVLAIPDGNFNQRLKHFKVNVFKLSKSFESISNIDLRDKIMVLDNNLTEFIEQFFVEVLQLTEIPKISADHLDGNGHFFLENFCALGHQGLVFVVGFVFEFG